MGCCKSKERLKTLNDQKDNDINQYDLQEDNVINQYDLVLVFKLGNKDKVVCSGDGKDVTEYELFQEKWSLFLCDLDAAGLEKTSFLSQNKKEVFCLVRADQSRLEMEALRLKYDLQLDPVKVQKQAEALEMDLYKKYEDKRDIWENIYGPYHTHSKELYAQYSEFGGENSIFRTVDRVKLLYIILETPRFPAHLKGAGRMLLKHISSKRHPLAAVFPLHEKKKLETLKNELVSCCSLKNMNLDEIRNYFGEYIAFYFAFLSFYTVSLSIPAIIGILTYVWGNSSLGERIRMEPIFGGIVCLWATIFREIWKRKESLLRGKWGMNNFFSKERVRPDFIYKMRPSYIDGKDRPYVDPIWKVTKYLTSYTLLTFLIIMVLSMVLSIAYLRMWLRIEKNWPEKDAIYLGSFLTAVGIKLMNVIYGKVAHKLNSFENHKTNSEYENNLIAKTFLFKFINSYWSLIYIAFVQKYDPGRRCMKTDPNCMRLLRRQLAVIFATHIFLNNFLELIIPHIKKCIAWALFLKKVDDDEITPTPAEEEYYKKFQYPGTFSDFDEISIQYGYATLFCVAFPLTPLFCLLNNFIELILDAHNFCGDFRRPEPRGAYSIGTWSNIYNILSYMAVFINVALLTIVGYGDEYMEGMSTHQRFIIFLIAEHFIFLFKFNLEYWITDEPHEESIRLQRQRYLIDVLINHVGESDDVGESDNKKNETDKTSDYNKEEEAIRSSSTKYYFSEFPVNSEM